MYIQKIKIRRDNKSCDNCEKHYIFAIPFLNLYQDSCKDRLQPSKNCKGFKRKEKL